MRVTVRRSSLVLAIGFAAACGDEPIATSAVSTVPPPPSLASPNAPVGVVVGQPLRHDATRGGTTFTVPAALSYRVVFEGATNNFAAAGGTVTGLPQAPGVTWVTIIASDALGRTASDRFAIVAFDSALATPTLPATPFRYADGANPLPAHFRAVIDGASVEATDNTPANNAITDTGASLGRVLFYDMRLSANDQLSCAGCHSPFLAFGDSPPRSLGFAGALTTRRTPALTNARFYRRGRFFWDERAATLEEQVLLPIQHPTEMGLSIENLVAKVTATSYYPPLFEGAFGSDTVTSDRVSRALAQYVRSLVSTDARYDRALNGTLALTPQERQGEALFRTTGCVACHTTVAQVSDSVHNIGLDAVDTDAGAGRGAFKAPSLRNVAVRPPFMHDGRFTTLEQVVAFFDSGVRANVNLDLRLRNANGTPRRLGLTGVQRTALVAFLHTLTDSAFLAAPRFANPFAPPVVPPATPTVPTTPTGIPPAVPPATPLSPSRGVTMQANAFRPATVTVAAGEVVVWTNLDNARHGVGFLTAGPLSTAIFTAGSRSVTMPATRGTYNYQCLVHGAGMRGTVIVQ